VRGHTLTVDKPSRSKYGQLELGLFVCEFTIYSALDLARLLHQLYDRMLFISDALGTLALSRRTVVPALFIDFLNLHRQNHSRHQPWLHDRVLGRAAP
jgi:hypothetical protein